MDRDHTKKVAYNILRTPTRDPRNIAKIYLANLEVGPGPDVATKMNSWSWGVEC